jgi:hypothetical protein
MDAKNRTDLKNHLPPVLLKTMKTEKKPVGFRYKTQFSKFRKTKQKAERFSVYRSVFDWFLFKIQILNKNGKPINFFWFIARFSSLSLDFSVFSKFKVFEL